MGRTYALVVLGLAVGLGISVAPRAYACGGCFHQPTPNQTVTVVTDHRMAFSLSMTQTVLWDQIRYQGSPQDFAWVLPVDPGARIEAARDEWLSALDAATTPEIFAPQTSCFNNTGGGGISCGCGSSAEDFAGDSSADASSLPPVTVISQSVVGPYLSVTIHSSSGEAISTWLVSNGYAIPPNIQPILDAYTAAGSDFIALKLAPGEGVQAMQPVRVITPGADPTLPLRMVSAGVGGNVGLELYVIAEGRYSTTNFPSLTIDPTQVVWNPYSLQSNYTDLFTAAVGNNGWVTEFSGGVPNLQQTYKAQCIGQSVSVPCTTTDAGTADASTDATDDAPNDATSDAVADASGGPDSGCFQVVSACAEFDDYDVATKGLNPYNVTVTRLRTSLPAAALAVDLKLGAGDQTPISNIIKTTKYSDPSYDPCAGTGAKQGAGCATAGREGDLVTTSFALLALVLVARRRTRR